MTRITPNKKYATYGNYREDLRSEAKYSCAYCGIYETENGGSSNFEIDHYQPNSIFKCLESEYRNLLYSCRRCNRAKHDYYPFTISPSPLLPSTEKYYLNPFEHDIENHIDKSKPNWVDLDATGKFNIDNLFLSSSSRIRSRKRREMVNQLAHKLKETITQLENRILNEKNPNTKMDLENELHDYKSYLSECQFLLNRRDD